MTITTAVGAAEGEERDPDPVGTVREETDEEGYYFAVWVKVGRAVVEGYGPRERVWINQEWLCVHSSEIKDHGKRTSEQHVLDFPIVGAVPNTPAHTQRLVQAAREMQDDVAQRFRKVTQRPSERMLRAFRERPGKEKR